MSIAKITLIGLERFGLDRYDKSLFSDIYLYQEIDKDTLINKMLLEVGELEVLYSNFEFFKMACNNFFVSYYDEFKRIDESLKINYNPTHNYDRHEEYTDISKSSSKTSGSNTNKNDVSAYDSNSYQAESRQTTELGENVDNDAEFEHKAHLYGNIGVTTNVQMLKEELNFRNSSNIYDIIINKFKRHLLISVYD